MPSSILQRARSAWQRVRRTDRIALTVLLLCGLSRLVPPLHTGRWGSLFGFLLFLTSGYFLIRLLAWARDRLLWSLRNRLIVAYVFIAVVPVLLLLVMAVLSAYLIYWQLGAYLLTDDIQKRVEKVAATADLVATTLASETAPGAEHPGARASSPRIAAILAAAKPDLPGLDVDFNAGQGPLERLRAPATDRIAGIVQTEDKLWLRAVVRRRGPAGAAVVSVSAPISPELIDRLAPELGPMQVTLHRLIAESDVKGWVFVIGDRRFVQVGQIRSRQRALQPPANWMDYEIRGFAKLEAILSDARPGDPTVPVLASFSARPAQLNGRLFSSLGEMGGLPLKGLVAIGIVFLVLEVAALVTGIVLTRTITRAVADLYRATQRVQTGDLTYRVRIPRRDQLGVLGESFNSMTGSIHTLIEEQRQRQRLENELSIAREVQAQLFPQTLPTLPGIQLDAVCRAARMVSGDYYDFIRLGPTQLGMALADISGKGISAALLMASLQAALRSQLLQNGPSSESTAELTARLNRHLFLSTADDRFATLFYAVYDSATRILRYTNAGHLPPFYIAGDTVRTLDEGGMVVGVLPDSGYEQGEIHIEPGSLLLAYSDGLTEPENVYGEEFGSKRLVEVALRHRNATPRALAETLMTAVAEWAGSPEQADDMTVMVVRLE